MTAAPDARVVLRARGLLESADLSLRFIGAHVAIIGRLTAAIAIPGFAASLAMHNWLGIDAFTTWFTSFMVAGLLEGPFTILCGQLALRRDATIGEALRTFSRRAFAFMLILLGAVTAKVVTLGILAPAFVFLPEIVLLEGAGRGAFRRARRMTSGEYPRAMGLALLLLATRACCVVLMDATLSRTLGVLFDVHVTLESLWSDGISPYALAGLWLSVPLCAVMRYVAYIDFRTIREGWDVQRRFQVLSTRLAAEEAAS